MSSYSLVQRGVAHADSTVGGGVSPLDIVLASPIKLGSTFRITNIRDRRLDASVQRGTVTISSGGTSPNDVTITAVDLACSELKFSCSENRDGNARGVTGKLNSTTQIRFEFYGTVDAAENIKIEWEVIERKARRGATLRVLDTTHLRMEWDGTLVAGESIDMSYEADDYSAAGDDVKEVLFRLQRLLAIGGENSFQDKQLYDAAGNPTTFRTRTFDTLAHCQAAVVDDAGGLATGELSRCTVTLTWPTGKNRPTAIQAVITDLIATPGVG